MLDGIKFKNMVISAANNIENQKQSINDLNVFPVPDGDTGTNMSMTISAARAELNSVDSDDIGFVSDKVASALLKGARGNSGVILSLLFRGFAKELKGKKTANTAEIARALDNGVKAAYGAVMKPTEGTILTVARVSAEEALELSKEETSVISHFEQICKTASETLDKTPEMLPVLKQANVVDAGGKGLLEIYLGMLSVLRDGTVIASEVKVDTSAAKADFKSFNNEDIKFIYCTEFLINKKTGVTMGSLRSYLHTMGDSVVAVEDADIIKVHIHTNNPGKVLEEAVKLGELSNIKIENMKIQHSGVSAEPEAEKAEQPKESEKEEIIAEPVKDFGFVAVSAGEGLSLVFKDLGADKIVEGGQTMNPSTEDLLFAINSVPAKNVFILPNNKNIIMAATQAAEVSPKNVIVIPTKTIPQGITAMLEFNPEASLSENEELLITAAGKVKTGQITFAARDSVFDDKEIKEGEILGLVENKVTFIEKNLEDCVVKVAKELCKDGASFVTVFYGSDVDVNDAEKLNDKLSSDLDCEINMINGGQPVYYYIISAE